MLSWFLCGCCILPLIKSKVVAGLPCPSRWRLCKDRNGSSRVSQRPDRDDADGKSSGLSNVCTPSTARGSPAFVNTLLCGRITPWTSAFGDSKLCKEKRGPPPPYRGREKPGIDADDWKSNLTKLGPQPVNVASVSSPTRLTCGAYNFINVAIAFGSDATTPFRSILPA